jgi:sugar phosphate isomerase/epimerase
MSLTVGAATYAWLWDRPLEVAIDRIAEMGYRHFEIMTAPPHVWPRGMDVAARRALRQHYEKRGLTLTSLNPTFLDLNMVSPNPGIREESLRQFREQFELAADLGAGLVVITVGRKHPLIAPDFEFFWRLAVDGARQLLPLCEKTGVTFGVENGWTAFTHAKHCADFVAEVRHERLKIVFDVANATIVNESPAAGLDLVKDHLALVHLSDTDDRTWGHNPVGSGMIDFGAVAAALKAIGYTGVSILEVVTRQEPERHFRDSLERLRACGWAP